MPSEDKYGNDLQPTEWHRFIGNGVICMGNLCHQDRLAPIHREENKPQWMIDAELKPDTKGQPERSEGWTTKDSGRRVQHDSGMQRDSNIGKPRFDLISPEALPFDQQMLTRWAMLMARGAEKYQPRNWELANSDAEFQRARESAYRHFMQWFYGMTDEDHAAAVMFNITEAEYIAYKLTNPEEYINE